LKRDNVKDAFSYSNPAEVVNKNVLLVDDICDSGATIREIGSLMSKLGVNKIAPLVIAKTVSGDIIEDKSHFSGQGAQLYSGKAAEKMTKEKPFAKVRKSYPRAYEKWPEEDDELLVRKFHQGESIAELANYFQRKEGAIRSRLIKLTGTNEIASVSQQSPKNYILPGDEEQICQALKKWRLKKAEENSLPAYCILPNTTLEHIAKTKPASLWELLDIKGLGKKTIKKFGEEILEVISRSEK
jgi:ATP-dependent DNA helicase RecQ